jgi:hypothetical protein
MNEIKEDIYFSRQEKIRAVVQFGTALAAALPQNNESEQQILKAIRSAFCAECVKCGSRVTGEELLSSADAPESEEGNSNLKRMRLGHCIQQDCDAVNYRLVFYRRAGLKWRAVFARMEEAARENKEMATATAGLNIGSWLSARRRVLAGIAVLVLLLLIRQWYFGGRIPLLREPEKFRVDPLPPGQTETAQDAHRD